MGFLIDTCIWIEVEQGEISPVDVAEITQEEPVYLSPVTVAELRFGAEITKSADIRQKRLATLARLVKKPILIIDEGTADIFGSVVAHLHKKGSGHRHRTQDLWLASQAIQHSFRFLTQNRKDFVDIPGLTLIVWKDVTASATKDRAGAAPAQ